MGAFRGGGLRGVQLPWVNFPGVFGSHLVMAPPPKESKKLHPGYKSRSSKFWDIGTLENSIQSFNVALTIFKNVCSIAGDTFRPCYAFNFILHLVKENLFSFVIYII